MNRLSMRVLVFVLGCITCSAVCRADETASVTGLVTDPQGRSVPVVSILTTNPATNVGSRTVTNEQGIYRVPALQPGIYRITVSKDGFKSNQGFLGSPRVHFLHRVAQENLSLAN